jgi:hypothetical protein
LVPFLNSERQGKVVIARSEATWQPHKIASPFLFYVAATNSNPKANFSEVSGIFEWDVSLFFPSD